MPPQCIAIIMDGNRRWAQNNGLTPLDGHSKGVDKLIQVAQWVQAAAIPHLIVYAFSNENWNRSAEEVHFLLQCINNGIRMFRNKLMELKDDKICIRFIGQLHRFSPELRQCMDHLQEQTEDMNTAAFVLWICLSYGGRQEIMDAAQTLRCSTDPISETSFKRAMWSADMPDPDIIIRTGGEMRLSGFLPWSGVYSELFFIQTLWPDLQRAELQGVLDMYSNRNRRYGL